MKSISADKRHPTQGERQESHTSISNYFSPQHWNGIACRANPSRLPRPVSTTSCTQRKYRFQSSGTTKFKDLYRMVNIVPAGLLPSKLTDPRAVIKSADTEDEELALQREYSNYRIPEIASSLYIRSLHDIVPAGEDTLKARCLVLEWMDTDLRCMTGAHFRGNKKLQWTVSNTVLNAFEIFKSLQKIHTGIVTLNHSFGFTNNKLTTGRADINLNNILVSGLDENSPIAKVADLGNCTSTNHSPRRNALTS